MKLLKQDDRSRIHINERHCLERQENNVNISYLNNSMHVTHNLVFVFGGKGKLKNVSRDH